MSLRTSTSLLLMVASLALPSVAFGQNAGDEQYSDPLAGDQTSQTTGSKDSSGTQATGENQALDQAAPAEKTIAPAPVLARTGFDLRLIAGLGIVLLALGFGLRRGGHARR
ncbi:unannotated protein [freshwater metagenome]|uniref:Unannotated protein n=1 Tax=freshwater metagenome TaxID=449393 RepID=A0A6J7EB61_9ZZZZ|nr:hypothetical protein [Actinomycetota bacterium]